MSMTVDDLSDHASNLGELLLRKRHQIAWADLSPEHRRNLETQIDALSQRVDQLLRQCARMSDQCSPALVVPGV
jgi:hypothetical protein